MFGKASDEDARSSTEHLRAIHAERPESIDNSIATEELRTKKIFSASTNQTARTVCVRARVVIDATYVWREPRRGCQVDSDMSALNLRNPAEMCGEVSRPRGGALWVLRLVVEGGWELNGTTDKPRFIARAAVTSSRNSGINDATQWRSVVGWYR